PPTSSPGDGRVRGRRPRRFRSRCRLGICREWVRVSASRCRKRGRATRVASEKGFFTDTTLCIGCKACEVACKQWNQLPDDGQVFTAMSYDNTAHLGASTWRHVAFVERPVALANQQTALGNFSWLLMSDVCK